MAGEEERELAAALGLWCRSWTKSMRKQEEAEEEKEEEEEKEAQQLTRARCLPA